MPIQTFNPPFTAALSALGVLTVDAASAPAPPPPPPPSPGDTTLRRRVIDGHFGCAKGIGFLAGVDGGELSYPLAAPAAKGALSLSFTSATPGAAQLLVVRGIDTLYYTVAGWVNAGVFTLCDPLECDVEEGDNVWSYWANAAHPNAKGYKAYGDYILRQSLVAYREVWRCPPQALSSTSIAINTSTTRMSSGSLSCANGYIVTPSGAGGGARYVTPVLPNGGEHLLVFSCNKGEAGADIPMSVKCDGVEIESYLIRTKSVCRHEVPVNVSGSLVIDMMRDSGAFFPSQISLLRKEEGGIGSLDGKRILVAGDSWVADPQGVAARIAERLPLAVVVPAGVGGDKSWDVLVRLPAVLAAHDPFDVVIIVVGTNDVYQGVSPEDFTRNLYAIVNKVQKEGAIPIVVKLFPGSTDNGANPYLDATRKFMALVPYDA